VTYTRKNDIVTLEMTTDDFNRLLIMLGAAVGAVSNDAPQFFRWMKFVNDLMATNPHFTPYEIPP